MRRLSTLSILAALGLVPLYASSNPILSERDSIRQFRLDTGLDAIENVVEGVVSGIVDKVEEWTHSQQTEKHVEPEPERVHTESNGIVYELVTHPQFPVHSMRVKSPQLCDPTVKQYSGYLDIDNDKHLFFWFFESRHDPKNAPLILWLNGGPGCSSSTGLLFELGPCNIADDGRSTTFNDFSWNSHANIIFLDQPINVGFSWSDNSKVNNTPLAAEHVYAFLELFINRYPEYAKAPFHIAAESYGGIYAPNIASVIHHKNKALSFAPVDGIKHINLASIMLGNGLTEPYTQFSSVPEYACGGPYPVFDDPDGPQCQALRSKVPTCQRLIDSCYKYNSKFACVPAALYCWSQMYGSFQQLGLNPYDVRRKCEKDKDGDLCYKQMGWIETYMNTDSIKKELGVDSEREFTSCNMEVNQAFMFQGDGMHNSAALIPELLNEGVRVLIYAGNADFMCNYMGNHDWVEKLDGHPFVKEYANATLVPWRTHNTGKVAGMVRTAGGAGRTAGNLTYVVVHEAGHMVPYDQPAAALDMMTRWILESPLTLNAEEFKLPFGGWA
jgi:carboxypeptidase C (cathepsin A)